jgi:alpha-tubulin suppressor-like RCC1 family protein
MCESYLGAKMRFISVRAAMMVCLVCVTLCFADAQARSEKPESIASSFANHTCAVSNRGAINCWGRVDALGSDTGAGLGVPVKTVGLQSGVKKVVTGESFSCALTISGAVKCWGFNGNGQLGSTAAPLPDGQLLPVDVDGLASGVSDIGAGSAHACAVVATGVKCWGFNSDGQVGDGTIGDVLSPSQVVGLAADVVKITGGANHSCALTRTGEVYCWGSNGFGQLGTGDYVSSTVPVLVALAHEIEDITLGEQHSCALSKRGMLFCWGLNLRGQVGVGPSSQTVLIPEQVFSRDEKVRSVSASTLQTCAITDRRAACWGFNEFGQLGDGSTLDRFFPVTVTATSRKLRAISPGYGHTCAITKDHDVVCWGLNFFGQLGNGTATNSFTAVTVNRLFD